MRTTCTTEEIEIAKKADVDPAAICLMENGFNPCRIDDIASSDWVIGNAFRQGYVEENDSAAHSLLDKLEGKA